MWSTLCAGSCTLRAFSPLFTEVPRRGVLRSSLAMRDGIPIGFRNITDYHALRVR
jgi:hypothetical protein